MGEDIETAITEIVSGITPRVRDGIVRSTRSGVLASEESIISGTALVAGLRLKMSRITHLQDSHH